MRVGVIVCNGAVQQNATELSTGRSSFWFVARLMDAVYTSRSNVLKARTIPRGESTACKTTLWVRARLPAGREDVCHVLPRASQVKRSPAARHEADIARERPSVLRNERHPSEHGWWPVVQDNTYEADTFTQSAAFMAAAGEGASVPPALD